jgi:UPF0271 protein
MKSVKQVVSRRSRKSKAVTTTKKPLLNCDLGESFGPWHMGHDEEIMSLIDCANIACGFHAGDPSVMRKTLMLAKRHKVEIGAHVGYPDLQGFGRRSMNLRGQELIDCIHYQMGALDGIARSHGVRPTYLKPHGALYNDMVGDRDLTETIIKAASTWFRGADLVVMATPTDKKAVQMGIEYGVSLRFEAFADRGYTSSGTLIPRSEAKAVLGADKAVEQALAISSQQLRSQSGKRLNLVPDTICVHGDTPDAVAIAKAIREALG